MPSNTIATELRIQLLHNFRPGQFLTIDRNCGAFFKADGNAQWLCRPLVPWPGQLPGFGTGRIELINLTAGNGDTQEVFIDRILTCFHRYGHTGIFQNSDLDFPDITGLLLQIPDRCMNVIITQATNGLVETKLIITHSSTAMGKMPGPQFIT